MVLSIAGLHAGYGHIEALRGIDVSVAEGEIVALLGANGAGKSTTLMTISGVVPARRGTITFDGQRIDRLPPEQIVRAGISQVPEGRRLFPQLSVLENLRVGAYARRDRNSLDKDYARVFGLFPWLQERARQTAGALSGGEQQMVAIGRALMGRPRLLLLDEPSLGLAPVVVDRIFDVIRAINEEGIAILLVEQNARAALEVAHRGYVLQTGQIVLAGPSATLAADTEVQRAYLG